MPAISLAMPTGLLLLPPLLPPLLPLLLLLPLLPLLLRLLQLLLLLLLLLLLRRFASCALSSTTWARSLRTSSPMSLAK